MATTKYLAKFQSPKIIEPEQNVNLICNSSLYTHIPIFDKISKFKGHNSAKNEM